MKTDTLKFHGKFRSTLQLALELQNAPKLFGKKAGISHSEVHFIEIIGDFPKMSITEIARKMHITKGGVSQQLKKLEIKECIKKEPDPHNSSRLLVTLTEEGRAIYNEHKLWHKENDGGFAKYLESLTDEQRETIMDFLTVTEDFLQRRLSSLK